MTIIDTRRPARATRVAYLTTMFLAALMWAAWLGVSLSNWGAPRISALELRLVFLALLASLVTGALWGAHAARRSRARHVAHRARLDGFERRISHLDQSVETLAGKTARLARHVEEARVGEEQVGENTGEIIYMAREHRPRPLRGLKTS